jgi:CheY-like chemotaxis protein
MKQVLTVDDSASVRQMVSFTLQKAAASAKAGGKGVNLKLSDKHDALDGEFERY